MLSENAGRKARKGTKRCFKIWILKHVNKNLQQRWLPANNTRLVARNLDPRVVFRLFQKDRRNQLVIISVFRPWRKVLGLKSSRILASTMRRRRSWSNLLKLLSPLINTKKATAFWVGVFNDSLPQTHTQTRARARTHAHNAFWPLALVYFLLRYRLLLHIWSTRAGIACRACHGHSSGSFLFIVTHTHTLTHSHTYLLLQKKPQQVST